MSYSYLSLFFITIELILINWLTINGQVRSDEQANFAEDWNITFNLFAPKDPNKQIILNFTANDTTIQNSGLDPKLKTKLIVHGWTSGLYREDLFNRSWMQDMKGYIQERISCNVICVDWSKPAGDRYLDVIPKTKTVGQMIAHFINRLIILMNVSTNDIHCIGHSLGAHICGFTGLALGSNKMAQISGLDPAGPGFDKRILSNQMRALNKNDASLVVVMHTSAGFRKLSGYNPGGFMGISQAIGHYDFRVNGGNDQPMCKQKELITGSLWDLLTFNWNGSYSKLEFAAFCPHETAYKYPIAKPENGCQFIAYKCADSQQFDRGLCAEEGMPLELNFDFYDNSNNKLNETNSPNNMFIRLGASQPYCLFHYQIVVETEGKLFPNSIKLTLFGRKQVDIEIKIGKQSKQNIYYHLYTDTQELGTVSEVTNRNAGLKFKAVEVNYMSHMNKGVRKEKSLKPRIVDEQQTEGSWRDWVNNIID